jgi:hypothetical protein
VTGSVALSSAGSVFVVSGAVVSVSAGVGVLSGLQAAKGKSISIARIPQSNFLFIVVLRSNVLSNLLIYKIGVYKYIILFVLSFVKGR